MNHHDTAKIAFDMASKIPQIKDQMSILKLHFNGAWGDIALRPQSHKLLLKFKRTF